MIRRLSCTAALVVALLGVSVSSAGAATVAPETWVPSACTTLQKYQQTVDDESATLTTSLTSVKNLKKGRAEIVKFLATMVTAAKTAKQEVQAAGEPAVTNGARIAAGLVGSLDDSAKLFAKSKAQAAKVSVKNEAAFRKQGTKVGTDLQKAAGNLRDDVLSSITLDTEGKLQAVALTAPECAFLAGS